MKRPLIIGRCAVPGCQERAVVQRNHLDGSHDQLCAVHGAEELATLQKYGTTKPDAKAPADPTG